MRFVRNAIALIPGMLFLNPNLAAAARRAVVIGIGAYPGVNVLHQPVQDARDVATQLRALNFSVTEILDAKLPDLTASLDAFFASLTPNDTIFFYYSGHGVQALGDNYLVPTDFNPVTEANIRWSAYPLQRVLDNVEAAAPEAAVIVLDSCRDNPFKGLLKSLKSGLAEVRGGTGTLIAFATGSGKSALPGPNSARNSLYTGVLLKWLAKPGMEVVRLFTSVQHEVARLPEHQVPWLSSGLVGPYYLSRSAYGCADGSREAFNDLTKYPGIAGCGATWKMNTLLAPRTGASCGDVVECAVPADACAPGWHVCGVGEYGPRDLSDKVGADECRDASPGEFVAALGDQTCDCFRGGLGAVCCGKNCVQQNGSCVWKGATAWFGMVDGHVQACADVEMRWDTSAYGILCCAD